MSVLIKPIITEKATKDSELYNCYTFVVDNSVNKIQIKQAIESTYKVSVKKIRTMIYPAKRIQKYTKKGLLSGKKGRYKKAIVQLKEGQSIDFYSNI